MPRANIAVQQLLVIVAPGGSGAVTLLIGQLTNPQTVADLHPLRATLLKYEHRRDEGVLCAN